MPRPGAMLYLIAYDIPSTPQGDRRRTRIARFLQGLGLRIQYSTFELQIPPERLPGICREIEQLIDEEQDSVRIYPLCGTCAGKAITLGCDAIIEHKALLVW